MAVMSATIGQRIAEKRKAAGLTQRELAARISPTLGPINVSRWERDYYRPSLAHALVIQRELGIPAAELLGEAVGALLAGHAESVALVEREGQ